MSIDEPQLGSNALLSFLDDKSCEDVVGSGRGVFSVVGSASMDDLLGLLADRNILSAPIVDEKGKFIGIIDVLDIVEYIISNLHGDFSKEHLMDKRINATASDLVDFANSALSAFVPSIAKAPIREVLKTFASSRLQRLVLYNSDTPSASIMCSQSDILRFLSKSFQHSPPKADSAIGNLLSRDLRDVGLVDVLMQKEKLYGCKYDAPVVDAVRTIAFSTMTGLPLVKSSAPSTVPYIVTPGDEIVGSFSASDLRQMRMEGLSLLVQHVSQFQNAKNPNSLTLHCQVDFERPGTVGQLIDMFASEHVHRVWVVQGKTPIGVISLGDFLSWMYSFRE